MYDVIVIGSGACGSMATQTLLEAGRNVLMLDGGLRDSHYTSIVPDHPFTHLRTTDPEQYRYFLGEEFESLKRISVATGAQLTPPRQFMVRDVDRYLPVKSRTFSPLESLARGGLASGWGLGCAVFSDPELQRASLDTGAMRSAYDVVAQRIGISGADDDARPYTSAHIGGIQDALPIDPTAGVLLNGYARKRDAIRRKGFRVGRPALALLSSPKDGRRASRMDDMEFYSDRGGAAWRAWMAIDGFDNHPRFQYRSGAVVLRYAEDADGVTVTFLDTATGAVQTLRCRRLLLAAGALGSARIALRSQANPDAQCPILCNPYTYLPSIVPGRLGSTMPERNIALSQMAIFHDEDDSHRDVAMGFVYSYRSLMTFRLMSELPIAFDVAAPLVRYIMSGFLIVGIHHPHANDAASTMRIEPDPLAATGDRLQVDFRLSAAEITRVRQRERAFAGCLRGLGAYPVRAVHPGNGASIHYAGTLPIATGDRPLTTRSDGKLGGTNRVFVADSSSFTFLPAKGLTLSAMARAHDVAKTLPIS